MSRLRSDGRYKDMLYVDGGPSSTQTVGHLRMEGRRCSGTRWQDHRRDRGLVRETGFTAADIDWFVPHQANQRIIDASADKLGIPPEKVVITVDQHGNTSAASIPLALSVAVADGRIKGATDPARGDGRRLHLGRDAAALVVVIARRARQAEAISVGGAHEHAETRLLRFARRQ